MPFCRTVSIYVLITCVTASTSVLINVYFERSHDCLPPSHPAHCYTEKTFYHLWQKSLASVTLPAPVQTGPGVQPSSYRIRCVLGHSRG